MTGFFTGKTQYYRQYRRGYPAEVFDAIISQFALTPESHILDLGCGTGNIAVPLAMRGLWIHAVDPEPEMLAEGKRYESEISTTCHIRWLSGADTTINQLDLPPLQVCIMGLSFHWMNRPAVLSTLNYMIEPDGGIACVNIQNGFHSVCETEWGGAAISVLREMLEDSWDYSGRFEQRKGDRHETIFAQSPFPVISEYLFSVQEKLTIDDIIGQLLST
ncbi:MAG: class I SAM-dependent methyltransferase, partial [Methanobacteriota archaeon]